MEASANLMYCMFLASWYIRLRTMQRMCLLRSPCWLCNFALHASKSWRRTWILLRLFLSSRRTRRVGDHSAGNGQRCWLVFEEFFSKGISSNAALVPSLRQVAVSSYYCDDSGANDLSQRENVDRSCSFEISSSCGLARPLSTII